MYGNHMPQGLLRKSMMGHQWMLQSPLMFTGEAAIICKILVAFHKSGTPQYSSNIYKVKHAALHMADSYLNGY